MMTIRSCSARGGKRRLAVAWLIVAAGLSGCALGTAQLRPDGGSLEGCLGGPHCVSSTAQRAERHIAPFVYAGSAVQAERTLRALLEAMPRTRIIAHEAGYLHAEVRSPIMRYVDDVEFLFQPGQRIDVRSSSRIGYYDFQVNRDRIERLRAGFDAQQR